MSYFRQLTWSITGRLAAITAFATFLVACQSPLAFLKPNPGPYQPPQQALKQEPKLAENQQINIETLSSSSANISNPSNTENQNLTNQIPSDQLTQDSQTVVFTASGMAEVKTLSASVSVPQTELINPRLCVQGLSGNLSTGAAGRNLLATYGLLPKRAGVATALEDRLSIAALDDDRAPSSKKSLRLHKGITNQLLFDAYTQSGQPYQSGGRTPATGFDPAGFVNWVYAQEGIKIPQSASEQVAKGWAVTREELRPGDILFYNTPKTEGYLVGIFTGNGNFILASSNLKVVSETAAFGIDYGPYFVGGRRYVDDPIASPLSDSLKTAAANGAVKVALLSMGSDIPKPTNIYGGSAKTKTSKKARPKKSSTRKKTSSKSK
ncbi:MAG: C40 family peptidase [Deltaproteobacteria bacterium]|jgi:cell wall-associated NlpC family hydrolase|nr:C40 family peptidase [Deltaproteobacteria bacterium]